MGPGFWIIVFLFALAVIGTLAWIWLSRRPTKETEDAAAPKPAAEKSWTRKEKALGIAPMLAWNLFWAIVIFGLFGTLLTMGGCVIGLGSTLASHASGASAAQEVPRLPPEELEVVLLHDPDGPLGVNNSGWELAPKSVPSFIYDAPTLKSAMVLTGVPVVYADKIVVEWLNQPQSWHYRMDVVAREKGSSCAVRPHARYSIDPGDTQIRLQNASRREVTEPWFFRLTVLDPGDEDLPADGKTRLRVRKQAVPASPNNWNQFFFGPLPKKSGDKQVDWQVTVEVQPMPDPTTGVMYEMAEGVMEKFPMRIWHGSAPTDRATVGRTWYEIRSEDVAEEGDLVIEVPGEVGSVVVFVSILAW